ncbi:MAG TPA: hypothetical protein V6C85_19005 [Allocoleopsis sp.]
MDASYTERSHLHLIPNAIALYYVPDNKKAIASYNMLSRQEIVGAITPGLPLPGVGRARGHRPYASGWG